MKACQGSRHREGWGEGREVNASCGGSEAGGGGKVFMPCPIDREGIEGRCVKGEERCKTTARSIDEAGGRQIGVRRGMPGFRQACHERGEV